MLRLRSNFSSASILFSIGLSALSLAGCEPGAGPATPQPSSDPDQRSLGTFRLDVQRDSNSGEIIGTSVHALGMPTTISVDGVPGTGVVNTAEVGKINSLFVLTMGVNQFCICPNGLGGGRPARRFTVNFLTMEPFGVLSLPAPPWGELGEYPGLGTMYWDPMPNGDVNCDGVSENLTGIFDAQTSVLIDDEINSAYFEVKHNCNVCGDGLLETPYEQCDDGDTESLDGCSSTCQTEVWTCGDGNVNPGEQCDDGNMDNSDACSNSCQTQVLDAGVVDTGFPPPPDSGVIDTGFPPPPDAGVIDTGFPPPPDAGVVDSGMMMGIDRSGPYNVTFNPLTYCGTSPSGPHTVIVNMSATGSGNYSGTFMEFLGSVPKTYTLSYVAGMNTYTLSLVIPPSPGGPPPPAPFFVFDEQPMWNTSSWGGVGTATFDYLDWSYTWCPSPGWGSVVITKSASMGGI